MSTAHDIERAKRSCIRLADANLTDGGLPTYTELAATLRLLTEANCPEAVAFVTQRAHALLARIGSPA